MSGGGDAVTVALAVGPPLIAGAASYALARRAGRLSNEAARIQNDAARIQVDSQAYVRAREIYEAAINQIGENLRAVQRRADAAEGELRQLRDCKDRLDQVEDDLRQTRRELATAKQDVAGVREENRRLATQVRQLRNGGGTPAGR